MTDQQFDGDWPGMLDGVLSDDPWAELDQAIRLLAGAERLRPEMRWLLEQAGQLYTEARVAGLCHDGALELVRDTLRSRLADPVA